MTVIKRRLKIRKQNQDVAVGVSNNAPEEFKGQFTEEALREYRMQSRSVSAALRLLTKTRYS